MRKFDNETENAMLDVNSFWKLERDPLYKKGIEEKSHVVIKNLIEQFGFSDEQVADVAEVSINFVKKVRKQLEVNK